MLTWVIKTITSPLEQRMDDEIVRHISVISVNHFLISGSEKS